MLFYHGTSLNRAEKILDEGFKAHNLVERHSYGRGLYDLEGRAESIYMTEKKNNAIDYGMRAAEEDKVNDIVVFIVLYNGETITDEYDNNAIRIQIPLLPYHHIVDYEVKTLYELNAMR